MGSVANWMRSNLGRWQEFRHWQEFITCSWWSKWKKLPAVPFHPYSNRLFGIPMPVLRTCSLREYFENSNHKGYQRPKLTTMTSLDFHLKRFKAITETLNTHKYPARYWEGPYRRATKKWLLSCKGWFRIKHDVRKYLIAYERPLSHPNTTPSRTELFGKKSNQIYLELPKAEQIKLQYNQHIPDNLMKTNYLSTLR